jgi:hypothetical protein
VFQGKKKEKWRGEKRQLLGCHCRETVTEDEECSLRRDRSVSPFISLLLLSTPMLSIKLHFLLGPFQRKESAFFSPPFLSFQKHFWSLQLQLAERGVTSLLPAAPGRSRQVTCLTVAVGECFAQISITERTPRLSFWPQSLVLALCGSLQLMLWGCQREREK